MVFIPLKKIIKGLQILSRGQPHGVYSNLFIELDWLSGSKNVNCSAYTACYSTTYFLLHVVFPEACIIIKHANI
jgi:hypothetical protein